MATKQLDSTVVKAVTTLTTAYTGFATTAFNVGSATEATFLLTIVKGTATSIQYLIDVEDATGTDWYTRMRHGTDGTAALDVQSITLSDLDATHRVSVPIDVKDARQVRLRAKVTGTADATLAAEIMTGAQQ